jgi:hypothetical protein
MLGDHRLHAVGGKHFEGAGESGLRLRVSIHPEKERAVGAGLAAVSADGLGDGDDNRRPISSLIAFRVLDFSRSARCARTSLRARFLWRSRQGRTPVRGETAYAGSRGADGPAREAGDAPSRTITACRRFGRIILKYGRFLVIF